MNLNDHNLILAYARTEASNGKRTHTLTHIGNLVYDILHPAIIFRMAMRSDIGGMFLFAEQCLLVFPISEEHKPL